MERKLFYTSPIDHDQLDIWPALARELRDAVQSCCSTKVSIALGEEPVFGYGTDSEEAFAALEDTFLDLRDVRIELWSSIRQYGILCFSLGAGITRSERRALMRKLKKKPLRRQTLLEEQEGPYYPDSRHVYAYSLPTDDDRALSSFHELVMGSYDPLVYLGENWLLMGKDEQIEEERYDIVESMGPHLSLFEVSYRGTHEMVWKASAGGDGLVAFMDLEDPALEILAGRFSERCDLRIFSTLGPWLGRVTLHRGHPEDHLAVVYAPPHQPEIEEPVVFMF